MQIQSIPFIGLNIEFEIMFPIPVLLNNIWNKIAKSFASKIWVTMPIFHNVNKTRVMIKSYIICFSLKHINTHRRYKIICKTKCLTTEQDDNLC